MKRVYNIIGLLLVATLFIGCDDVFEENISDDSITVISPKDDAIINSNSVTFRWDVLDGASEYNVQVSEQSSFTIVLDSMVQGNILSVQMQSGIYDWQVRGENFAYVSSYSFPESFSIESTNNLADQNVFLNAPSDNFYTGNNTIILSWSVIQAADSYSIQVEKTLDGNTSIVLQQNEITGASFTLDSSILDEDAVYGWSIKAVNDISETSFSSRNIFLDTTVPNQPTLTSPNDNDTTSTTVDFTWNSGADTGNVQSPLANLLEISTDENFSSIVQSYNTGEVVSQQHTFSNTGIFYWRVRISDEAGNESSYSETRSITVE
ncbi:hypothetical protein [Flagellimonas sp. CMM7]|uniref:hypothetical protein n=1 Tax=Flagellimonas sp. CMM7 TaxID=2654676 RepID=UPI0013CFC294|nr:hypothetical protein [Flagellimonas sp. CMM7]UII80129.1 hypothetical protein LV704_01085 [Flagellimonas sp. CMM7]